MVLSGASLQMPGKLCLVLAYNSSCKETYWIDGLPVSHLDTTTAVPSLMALLLVASVMVPALSACLSNWFDRGITLCPSIVGCCKISTH